MAKVKLEAIDQLHISSVKADSLQPGERFEVSEAEAKSLIERKLARKVAATPANKARQTAPNKSRGKPN